MGVFVDGVEYDISIKRSTGEQQGFMIIPHSDRRERIDDFAPNIGTTGELAYATGIWRPWTQDTWEGGLGQEKWESANAQAFYEAESVETRIPGRVMLATAVSLSDSGWAAAQPVDFNSRVYMRCTATNVIREYTDGVGWASKGIGKAHDPTDAIVFGDKLYVASANTHYIWFTTGGSCIRAPVDREHLAVWNPGATPALYGSHGHQVFASTDGSTWGSAISIGDSSAHITSLCPYNGNLYAGKEDGLFFYDGTDVIQVIDCKNRLWTQNFIQMAEFEGYLYFNILRKIYKYSTSAIVDITPRMYGDLTKETYGYGLPEAFVAGPGALYVGFDLAENDYPCVLAYNGLGWHPVFKGDSGVTFHGMGYSPELDWLIVNDSSTRSRQLVSQSDMPYPAFAGTGSITTPKFDGGMPQTSKAVKSVILHTRGCVVNKQDIDVAYRKDGATAWTHVGTVSSSPREELSLAPLTGAIEVTQDIQFRFTLTTTSPANTPVLEHVTVNWLPRPEAVYAHVVSVRLGSPIPLG